MVHWSDDSLVQKYIGPKKCVTGPMAEKSVIWPKFHWSNDPLVRKRRRKSKRQVFSRWLRDQVANLNPAMYRIAFVARMSACLCIKCKRCACVVTDFRRGRVCQKPPCTERCDVTIHSVTLLMLANIHYAYDTPTPLHTKRTPEVQEHQRHTLHGAIVAGQSELIASTSAVPNDVISSVRHGPSPT